MTDDDNPNVTLKDVYQLVGQARKDTSDEIAKVNGDVVDLKVAVGKIDTKLDGQVDRVDNLDDRVGDLDRDFRKVLSRAQQRGGIAGTLAAVLISAIDFFVMERLNR